MAKKTGGTRRQAATPRRSRDVNSSLTPAPKAEPTGRKVRAERKGFYDGNRVREGDIFGLRHTSHFDESWMSHDLEGTPAAAPTPAGRPASADPLNEE